MAMTEPAVQQDQDNDLQELSDPEFFTRWAAARSHLFETPEGNPWHGEVKRQYDAMNAEYRRRICGGITVTGRDHVPGHGVAREP